MNSNVADNGKYMLATVLCAIAVLRMLFKHCLNLVALESLGSGSGSEDVNFSHACSVYNM